MAGCLWKSSFPGAQRAHAFTFHLWLLSSRGHVAREAEKIYYLALYGKQFASSGLGVIGAGCASHFV